MTLRQVTVVPLRIGGKLIHSGAGVLTVKSPYDGRDLGEVVLATRVQADQAVQCARAAFEDYGQAPSYQRSSWLIEASARLEDQAEVFARLLAEEVGKPIRAARAEVERAAMTLRLSGEEARRLQGEVLAVDATPAGLGKRGMTIVEPVGVISCIVPFNYPLNLLAHKVGPALAAGNTVVIKPSPKAVLCVSRLVELLESVGFPPGTVNLIACDPEVAELLVTHSEVSAVSFTGSASVGRAILKQAGLKRVVLELGSNAGNVVARSADLDLAAAACAAGGFVYAGQSCISVQRVYVQRSVMVDFAERLTTRAAALRLGDPLDDETDVGPLIDEASAARVDGWVAEAVSGGARILCGSTRKGNMFAPTVVTDVSPQMKIVCEEVFGPVVSLLPYDDLSQALAAVNQSRYGLHAGVFTRDLEEATQAVKDLRVGGVVINDSSTFRSDLMPYGGVRESGIGREGIRFAMSDLTHLKAVYMPF